MAINRNQPATDRRSKALFMAAIVPEKRVSYYMTS
jgi:hypothetical protein